MHVLVISLILFWDIGLKYQISGGCRLQPGAVSSLKLTWEEWLVSSSPSLSVDSSSLTLVGRGVYSSAWVLVEKIYTKRHLKFKLAASMYTPLWLGHLFLLDGFHLLVVDSGLDLPCPWQSKTASQHYPRGDYVQIRSTNLDCRSLQR